MVDVTGKVPHPGTYIFIVHYYQPVYPGTIKSISIYFCIYQVIFYYICVKKLILFDENICESSHFQRYVSEQ